MKKDPVLAKKDYTTEGETYTLTVYGGLHYINGNSAPYFSLTYWEHLKDMPGCQESGGAGHEHIVKHFPHLADLAALHLSDIYGAPMYAAGNGWYWLAGVLGGAGEQYHGGNQEYLTDTPLNIFAKHCRISLEEAQQIANACLEASKDESDPFEPQNSEFGPNWKLAKRKCVELLEAMRPRWKQEAEDCIKKHGLKVYGDTWKAS